MAQPVPFFHIFVVNPQFRQSVFDAGLTFHPDTDPANPVLINLNSSRFGMAERISALSPPAGLEARVSTSPRTPTSRQPPTPSTTDMSPLSEPAQTPQHLPLLNPAFLTPNIPTAYDPTNTAATAPSPSSLNPDLVHQFDQLSNPANLHHELFDPVYMPDPAHSYDESLIQQFTDGVRLDVSDTESEKLSEADIIHTNGINGIKHPSLPVAFYDIQRPSIPLTPLTPRRRNGRSRVVSRAVDIRMHTHPIVESQSEKARAELVEQIAETFPRITPSPDFPDVRAHLLTRLRQIISSEWQGAGIDIYGSAGNGLGLRSADVDMSLYMPKEVADAHARKNAQPGHSPKQILARLAIIMQQNNMVILSELLDARVPVIKMMDTTSSLQVDVCVNNILAVRNTELLNAYVDLDERFRYVCVLVKLWAKRRELNDAYHGTLSSYAYTLMVINYLQTVQPPILPCLQQMVDGKHVDAEKVPKEMTDNGNKQFFNTYFDRTVTRNTYVTENTQPVHELLMGFFRYFGYTFKYRTDLVSIRIGTTALRSIRGWDENTVYDEWEAKQTEYKTAYNAARAEFDARKKAIAEIEEKRIRENESANEESPDSKPAEVALKPAKVHFPKRPRLASKHLFCIEDPFDIDHDLSRGMEKAAVNVIRQEMMRAYEQIAETGDFELVCEEYR